MRTYERAIVIMTKAPNDTVKTRLVKDLCREEVTRLYRCFLKDVAAAAEQVKSAEVIICYTPPEDESLVRRTLPGQTNFMVQSGADLGERMYNAASSLFEVGYRKVVLIGADIPSLPSDYLEMAFAELKKRNVVLGPTQDGGYYIIGLTAAHKALFEGIDWGTCLVLEQTKHETHSLGLGVVALPELFDIDTLSDLEHLAANFEQMDYQIRRVVAQETQRCMIQMGMITECVHQ